jgi:O-acetyl-ADP-ribose deacetylase (regulator of RNase III)
MTMREMIEVFRDDIVKQEVYAIVNAANNSLLSGGDVDCAIHSAAGPGLLEECRKLNGCPTVEARITKGYSLPAKCFLHTVGPIWKGGTHGEDEMLALCNQNSLVLAEHYGIRTVAFPSISTGAYGFLVEGASRIAVCEIKFFLERSTTIEEVVLVCFNKKTCQCYSMAVEEIVGKYDHNNSKNHNNNGYDQRGVMVDRNNVRFAR